VCIIHATNGKALFAQCPSLQLPIPHPLLRELIERKASCNFQFLVCFEPFYEHRSGNVSQPHFGAKCENATHIPKSGKMESSGTPENSEDDLRGQISSPWCVLYRNGKILKSRCPKWPRIAHLDICSPSYGKKKGRESNCQFDSRPLKVGN